MRFLMILALVWGVQAAEYSLERDGDGAIFGPFSLEDGQKISIDDQTYTVRRTAAEDQTRIVGEVLQITESGVLLTNVFVLAEDQEQAKSEAAKGVGYLRKGDVFLRPLRQSVFWYHTETEHVFEGDKVDVLLRYSGPLEYRSRSGPRKIRTYRR